MKRYLVKVDYEATESNQYFAGEQRTYYYGKDYKSTESATHINSLARYWGYTTKASAASGLRAHQSLAESETKRGHWNVSCELLEIELAE